MKYIEVLNMTSLFKKELLIYSLFDIRFHKPFRVVYIMYIFLLGIVWTVPFSYIFGIGGPYTFMMAILPPIGLAGLMAKPIWGGKSFFDWFITQIKYLGRPKFYYDLKNGNPMKTYKINHEITVSRRDDFYILKELRKQRKKGRK